MKHSKLLLLKNFFGVFQLSGDTMRYHMLLVYLEQQVLGLFWFPGIIIIYHFEYRVDYCIGWEIRKNVPTNFNYKLEIQKLYMNLFIHAK